MNFTRKDFVQDSKFLAWVLQRLWLLSCDSTTSTLKIIFHIVRIYFGNFYGAKNCAQYK
jgi:hypothetical protein